MMEVVVFLALFVAYTVLAAIGLIVVVRRLYRLLAHAGRVPTAGQWTLQALGGALIVCGAAYRACRRGLGDGGVRDMALAPNVPATFRSMTAGGFVDWLNGYALGVPAIRGDTPAALVIAATFDWALRSGMAGWGAERPIAQGFVAGVEQSYGAEVGGRVAPRATATAAQSRPFV